MRAVIYARFSSEKQTENSIDAQLRACKEYAERKNLEIVNTFKEDLNSNYNVVWERPEGGGAFIGRLMKNGEEVMRQNIQEDFKPHLFKLYTVNYTNMFLDKRLEELKATYRRSRE